MALTILEGSTFCICDARGDVEGETAGFFADDTRHLSLFRLTVNGQRPLLLSSGKVEYFSAAFYLRNPLADLPQDAISIVRTRFVGDGMQDRFSVRNESMQPLSFELALDVGSDFADIFAVKSHDFSLGDPLHASPLPPLLDGHWLDGRYVLEDAAVDGDRPARTQVVFSLPGQIDGSRVAYPIELQPREQWELIVDVFPSRSGELAEPKTAERHFGDEVSRVRDSLAAWQLRIPQIKASWDALGHAFNQSVADLASLRMRGARGRMGKLPAAGMPWFMTVFGRDTLLTCLQTLLFGPELARTALEVLAELQATELDPTIDAEPGKIVHEVRHGKAATNWFRRYYGTVDATPLYLVLLHEVWSWTDDAVLARELRAPALRALEWIDKYGDRDGDGFVEYEKRAPHGLDNQSWKDSLDSQRFNDGRLAHTPIAPCEVQGYVYDAKVRTAEIARAVWRDRPLADRLEREAAELKERFDEAYWIEEDGGFYALALDGDKQRVDSLTSNIGHLLWSGIVKDDRVDAVVDQLMSEHLWSGWGVRTMSMRDAGYNPLSYHNGTVWPHDNSLIAWGLARYGRWTECHRIVRRMLDAASHFDWQLPEVFAGMARAETPFPIAYPTAARPQAWAAGTPVLLLQLLLGVRPNRARHVLETIAPDALPAWTGDVRLSTVRAYEGQWDVHLQGGRVRIDEA